MKKAIPQPKESEPVVDLVSLKTHRSTRDQLRKVAALEERTLFEVTEEALHAYIRAFQKDANIKLPAKALPPPKKD